MNARTRTALAAALILGIAVGPPAPAALATVDGSRHAADAHAPDSAALRAALAGLPDAGATAALVRVGGTDGVW
ncbi:peptidase, partial [Streptomyces sp. SID3212]|nr:peptidase [Streptomyces sp. SID3212]